MRIILYTSIFFTLSCQSILPPDGKGSKEKQQIEDNIKKNDQVLKKLEQIQVNMANLQTQFSDVDSRLQNLTGKLEELDAKKTQVQQFQDIDTTIKEPVKETPIREKIERPKEVILLEEVNLKGLTTKQKLDLGKKEFQNSNFARVNYIYSDIQNRKEKISNIQLNQIHHEKGIVFYRLEQYELP